MARPAFNLANRRTHLYAGLFFAPWILLYALSSIPFNHESFFEARDKAKGVPLWTRRAEIPFDVPVPEGENLRPLAARIVQDTGLKGAFGAYRPSHNEIDVYVYTVWHSTQVKYLLDRKVLVVADRRFRWDQMLTGLHAKGGFEQESLLDQSWSILVDLVCVAFLAWIATGLYMWWTLSGVRAWGWLALLGGFGAFALLLTLL